MQKLKDFILKKENRKYVYAGAFGLFACVVVLFFAVLQKKTPENADELIINAINVIEKASYVDGEINYRVDGVQDEENVDVHINMDYVYDVKNDVCNAKMKYAATLGEMTSEDNASIWSVGEKVESKTGKLEIVNEINANATEIKEEKVSKKALAKKYFTYSKTASEENWRKEAADKTNDELYRLNVYELMKQNGAVFSLRDNVEVMNEQECYVVDATFNSFVADVITDEVDILSAISSTIMIEHDAVLYFNKKWEPVKVILDFADEVIEDGENRGIPIALNECYYSIDYKKLNSMSSLKLPSEIRDTAIEITSIKDIPDEEIKNPEENYKYEYPLIIADEESVAVEIAEVKSLIIDSANTYPDYAYFSVANHKGYNYVDASIYNYSWASSEEQAVELLTDSIVNMKEYISDDSNYQDVKIGEIKERTINDFHVRTINIEYSYEDSKFIETTAFVKVAEKQYLRIGAVSVIKTENDKPIDAETIIKTLVENITVKGEE